MKNYLFLSAVGAMMLAACSNDDTVPVESPDVAQSGQTLTLTLNTGQNTIFRNKCQPGNYDYQLRLCT